MYDLPTIIACLILHKKTKKFIDTYHTMKEKEISVVKQKRMEISIIVLRSNSYNVDTLDYLLYRLV